MNIKKHIPNALTCCNLVCGVYGIHIVVMATPDNLKQSLTIALTAILVAAAADFLDGFAARLLKASSPIGKELDSLADLVSFGVLPGFILVKLIEANPIEALSGSPIGPLLPYIAYLVPVFSALRLAKFNIDTRQNDSFIGMPTPAFTLFIAGIAYIFVQEQRTLSFLAHPIALVGYASLGALLLISELPLIALKFKHAQWKGNETRYLLIFSSFILLIVLKLTAIPIILILYLLLSFIEFIKKKTPKST